MTGADKPTSGESGETARLLGDHQSRGGQTLGGHDRDDSALLLHSADLQTIKKDYYKSDLKASPWRWWALFVFSMVGFVQNVVWITFSTVQDAAEDYYGITGVQTLRLAEVATIAFVPATFVLSPLSDRFGLRPVVIISSFCIAAGSVSRWLGRHSYLWLMLGQSLNGVAGPVCMIAPPQLAAQWFPLNQRASATALAWTSQTIGVAVGYLIGPRLAKTASDLPHLNFVSGTICVSLFVLSLTYPRKPKHAPTRSAQVDKTGFIAGARVLIRNPIYMVILVAIGCSCGTALTWATFLDDFLGGTISDEDLGNIGFFSYIANICGALSVGLSIDLFHLQRRMRLMLIVLFVLATMAVAAFLWLVYLSPVPVHLYVLGTVYVTFGFFFGAVAPLALELAAEISFPVSEETAAAYIMLAWNIIDAASFEIFYTISPKTVNFVTIAIMLGCLCLLLSLLCSTPKKTRISFDDGPILDSIN